MDFKYLIDSIQQTHTALVESTNRAINTNLTIRNWLIGFYIAEFEQKGEDRAKYGEKLLQKLAESLKQNSFSFRNLQLFRQFYNVYPQIMQSVIAQFSNSNDSTLISIKNQLLKIGKSSIIQFKDERDVVGISLDTLISKLSFTHLVQLFSINNLPKRSFYEIECIKGSWSVAELKRQINSLYFERSGLSQNPGKLSGLVATRAKTMKPADIVKSVFVFEFLGLKSKEVVEESDLETALLNNLQEFMLELGHGFCLEARQKRTLIGDEYYFIDLVFYHRILKCHVLIDLKTEEFTHNNAGQLNTYLNYYKAEVSEPGDNPPVGILLVTNKNQTLVEYATAGMDSQLFVSKYMVELPSREQLEKFLKQEMKRL